ncbi:glucokinase [Dongia sp.]|uniref:glucokinase n=1 Tax=Dongia sp. TaxID=1977262 RepID=UPI0035B1CC36
MTPPGLALVADIGGTNARFALRRPGVAGVERMKTLSARDYPDIATAITAYLDWAGAKPAEACFAVACPAREDYIEFTNSTWRFSRYETAQRFGWTRLETINDFEALALGVPHVKAEGLHNVRRGTANPLGARAVLGPGTGFGVSGLVCDRHGGWVALAGEGGHVGFAPQDELEIDLLRYLQARFGRVSCERLLSGEGLVNIYEFLTVQAGKPAERPSPAEITARGLEHGERIARDALRRFCAILGSAAGDLALILGSTGGVYIGGGIVPRLLPILLDSRFEERFANKGRLSSLLANMPIYVILDNTLALLGAAATLSQGDQ